MKEWEIRRLIYLKTNPDPGDIIMFNEAIPVLQGKQVVVFDETNVTDFTDTIIWSVISYFSRSWEKTVVFYPSKSYAVAIIYAKLLEKYFQEPFYDSLNHPGLLLTDKYFVPYNQSNTIYDRVISHIDYKGWWDFEKSIIPQVQATVEYFLKEFSIEQTM